MTETIQKWVDFFLCNMIIVIYLVEPNFSVANFGAVKKCVKKPVVQVIENVVDIIIDVYRNARFCNSVSTHAGPNPQLLKLRDL